MDPGNVTELPITNFYSYYYYDEDENNNTTTQSVDNCPTGFLHTISLVITCVAFVFGTIGNSLVIYVTGFRMKKSVNSVWFLNLALADFLFTVFLIISIIKMSTEQERGWILGDFLCKCSSLVNVLNMFASIFILTAISVDRCLSAWLVVWAQNHRTPRKAQFTCAGIWLASLACSLPFSVSRKVQYYPTHLKHFCTYNVSINTYRHIIAFRFVVGFLIPFLVIIGSNVAIGMRTRHFQRRSLRSLRIIVAVILAFFICWLPFHIFQFLDYYKLTNTVGHTFYCVVTFGVSLSGSLAFLNSCVNPILYVFMCAEFQKKLHQSVCLVFESALAEDHTFTSSRSLSSHLSIRGARKSESQADTANPLMTTSSDLKC